MVVEIFAAVNFHYQLVKLEPLCIVVSFGLPVFISVVPFGTHSLAFLGHYCGLKIYKDENSSVSDPVQKYVWYIPGLAVAGLNVILIIVALLSLFCQFLKRKFEKIAEEEELIFYRNHEIYSRVFRETLPLVMYPITILVSLTIDVVNLTTLDTLTSTVFNSISDLLTGCMGGITAVTFFVHFWVKFWCLIKKRPPVERVESDDPFQPINIQSSNADYGATTYYTAEDGLEGNK